MGLGGEGLVGHHARNSMAPRSGGWRRLLAALVVGSGLVTAVALAPGVGSVTGRLLGASGSAARTGLGGTPAVQAAATAPKTSGACSGVDFVSARGSGEPWDSPTSRNGSPYLPGSPEANAALKGILQVLPAKGATVPPVDVDQLGGPGATPNSYQAPDVKDIVKDWSWNPLKLPADLNRTINVNLPKYLASEQVGETELYTYLSNTYLDCQSTGHEPMVVLAGYSQGAMVVHNVLNLLALGGQTGVASIVKGAVLIADPERTPLSDVVNFGTATAGDEGICPWAEGSAIGKLDAFSCVGSDRTTDVDKLFAKSAIAVCDEKDIVCDWSADVHSNVTTDIQDVKYGHWVHVNCHSYCGNEVITAGKRIGRELLADGLGATPAPSSSPPTPSPTPTSTGAGAASWTALAALAPAGATSGSLDSVTCPSTTCVAMGWDSKGILIVSGSGSSWTAADTPGPASTEAGASIDPEGGPNVACATPFACTGVGFYIDHAGGSTYSSYLVTGGSGGPWTVRQPPLPANALSGGDVELKSVACPSTTQCVAVGVYTDSSYSTEGLVLTGSGSSWQATESPLPADAATSYTNTQLNSVACSSASQCVIGGSYAVAGSGTYPAYAAALILTGSGSAWTPSTPPVPANAIADATNLGVASLITQVTCPASGCVAVGDYMDTSKADEAMMLTQSGTSWTAAEPALPGGTPGTGQGSTLTGLGCASSACTAWGEYDTATSQTQIMIVNGSGTSWHANDVTLTGNWRGNAYDPDDVACLPTAVCTAVVGYGPNPNYLITGSGSTWTASLPPMPSDTQPNGDSRMTAVACSSAQCVAVGYYTNSSDSDQALLEMGPSS